MSRNSSAPDESNLELLLDTICNTFGVVLFISMLVVIRVNASKAEVETQPVEESSELELIERQLELDEARSRIQQLRDAMAQQQSVAERFASSESRRLAVSNQRDARELADRLDEKQDRLTDIATRQQAINQQAKELQEQSETLAELRREAASVEAQLQREVAQRSRSSRAPEMKESKREAIPIFVRNGRLCRYFTPLQGRLSRNSGEIAKSTDASGNVVYDVVPGAGLAVSSDPPNIADVKAALAGFSPDEHVLQVFFWSESFPHAQVLRDAMVELGFRYALIPMPDGENVVASNNPGPVYEQ